MRNCRNKHTPGPWTKHKLPDGRWLIHSDNTNVAGTAHEGFGPSDEAVEQANATLIEAAPELVEALKALRFQVSNLMGQFDEDQVNAFDKAGAAIKAATS